MSNDINYVNNYQNTYANTTNDKTKESTTIKDNSSLGKDAFLQLLVTQLKNQDPLSPVDNKDFISQMAQFTSLEQMTNMNKSIENLTHSLNLDSQQSLIAQGASLIGKVVSGVDNEGQQIAGAKVESVNFIDGIIQLNCGDKTIDLSNVNSVSLSSETAIENDNTNEDTSESIIDETQTQIPEQNDLLEV